MKNFRSRILSVDYGKRFRLLLAAGLCILIIGGGASAILLHTVDANALGGSTQIEQENNAGRQPPGTAQPYGGHGRFGNDGRQHLPDQNSTPDTQEGNGASPENGANNDNNTGNSNNSSKNNGNSGNKNNSGSGGNYSGGGSGVLARPVASGSVTAGMYYPSGSYHGAIDYGVPAGTPVYAAADGVVIKTANLTTSYGTYVVIQHANGIQTWYAHGTSGSICVSAGQTVSRGQQIMKSGNSGHSTGAHLHFEVRVAPYDYNTCRVNPTKYM